MRDDQRWVTVTARVDWNRGQRDVEIERIAESDGSDLSWRALGLSLRRKLLDDLVAADSIVRDVGDTTCKHGRYLIAEFCTPCLAEAKATP